MIDILTLTLDEVATIENLSGQGIGSLNDDEKPKGLVLAALAMIAKRKAGDKTFTWNQARQLTLPEANEILGIHDDDAVDEIGFTAVEVATTQGGEPVDPFGSVTDATMTGAS